MSKFPNVGARLLNGKKRPIMSLFFKNNALILLHLFAI